MTDQIIIIQSIIVTTSQNLIQLLLVGKDDSQNEIIYITYDKDGHLGEELVVLA